MPSTVTGYELTVTVAGADNIVQGGISVSPNTQYVFSFYAKQGTCPSAKYSVIDSTHVANIINPTSYFARINSTSYTKVSVPFTTPAGCVAVAVYLDRDNGGTGTIRLAATQVELGGTSTSWELTTTTYGSKNLLTFSGDLSQAGSWPPANATIAATADTFTIDPETAGGARVGIPESEPSLWNAPQRPGFPQASPPPLWNKASD